MLASKPPKIVVDLYEWLPPYGETSVSLRTEGLTLEVNIFYGYSSDGPEKLRKKTLAFTSVSSFAMASFPGVATTAIRREGSTVDGSLVEFTDSEAARQWQKHWSRSTKPVRHFHLIFLAQNRQLEVFAEDCQLLE
jgi:hypothetical protein